MFNEPVMRMIQNIYNLIEKLITNDYEKRLLY